MAIEKILLVDNISKYRDSVRDFLELYDYTVIPAGDPETAIGLAVQEKPSLAVIDVRLLDDADDKDESGLILARKLGAAFPKIMLTAFPSYQAVRGALAPLDGPPIADRFVAKQEGLHKLLNTIREVLGKLKPELGLEALGPFEVQTKTTLPGEIKQIDPGEIVSHIRKNEEALEEEIVVALKRESNRISQLHQARFIAVLASVALILIAIAASLCGAAKLGWVSMAASIITNVINAWFSKPQEQAYQLERELREQLALVRADKRLLSLCDYLESTAERDKCRKKMIEHIRGHHSTLIRNSGRVSQKS